MRRRTHRRNVSAVTPTFSAIDRIASHCDEYCPTCSNTTATERSRSSRGYLDDRAMITFSTHTWSLHQTRGGSVAPADVGHLMGSRSSRGDESVTCGDAACMV